MFSMARLPHRNPLRIVRRRRAGLVPARDGAAAMEFAIGALVLIPVVLAVMEFSMIVFVTALLEAGIRESARFGLTGRDTGGLTREQQILQIVQDRSMGLVDVSIANMETLVYPSFEAVGQAEPYTDDNGNEVYDPGEPYVDSNGNGAWDGDMGVPGAGEAREIVLYRVEAVWRPITPVLGALNLVPYMGPEGILLAASVVIRNEPY
ncbi:MAG: TadE/TadG family type IV pilus assembly protein [Inquilinaceae bacterium]